MTRSALAEAAGEQCRILTNGDAALVVEFGDRIDLTLNERVLALADRIAAAAVPGILETIPTFRSTGYLMKSNRRRTFTRFAFTAKSKKRPTSTNLIQTIST